MTQLGEFLQQIASEGQWDSRGSFTLSLKESLTVFASALRLEPSLYLLKAIQALVALGSPRIEVSVAHRQIQVRGQADASRLLRALAQSQPVGGCSYLAWSVWGGLAAGASRVVWSVAGEDFCCDAQQGWTVPSGAVAEEAVETICRFEFPLRWTLAGLKRNLSRAWLARRAVAHSFAFAPLPLLVKGRMINDPRPQSLGPGLLEIVNGTTEVFTSLSVIRADVGWLQAEKPAMALCSPLVHLPTRIAFWPSPATEEERKLADGFSSQGSRTGVTERFYMLRLDEAYEVRQLSWLGPRSSKQIPLARRLEFPVGQLQIGVVPKVGYEVVPPRAKGILAGDGGQAGLPLLGGRCFACFDYQGSPRGTLFLIQDGLLHRPLDTGIRGLTLVVGEHGLPVDAGGLTPVVGPALHEVLLPIRELLLQWHEAGANLHGFWDEQGREEWARLGASLRSFRTRC